MVSGTDTMWFYSAGGISFNSCTFYRLPGPGGIPVDYPPFFITGSAHGWSDKTSFDNCWMRISGGHPNYNTMGPLSKVLPVDNFFLYPNHCLLPGCLLYELTGVFNQTRGRSLRWIAGGFPFINLSSNTIDLVNVSNGTAEFTLPSAPEILRKGDFIYSNHPFNIEEDQTATLNTNIIIGRVESVEKDKVFLSDVPESVVNCNSTLSLIYWPRLQGSSRIIGTAVQNSIPNEKPIEIDGKFLGIFEIGNRILAQEDGSTTSPINYLKPGTYIVDKKLISPPDTPVNLQIWRLKLSSKFVVDPFKNSVPISLRLFDAEIREIITAAL